MVLFDGLTAIITHYFQIAIKKGEFLIHPFYCVMPNFQKEPDLPRFGEVFRLNKKI